MAELANLVNERGLAQSKLTRAVNFIKTFTVNDSINLLKARLPQVQSAYSEFNAVQSQIENIDEQALVSSECDVFETKYFFALATIQDILDAREPGIANQTNLTQQAQGLLTNGRAPITPNIQVKLPALNLPIFKGNYSEWLSFYDMFNTLIHENQSLYNCQKFHYLKSCVKDDAARAIESLTVSNANYLAAIEVLKKRFNNKRLITQEHVCSIINSPLISKSTHTSLRQLLNDITTNIEALKILDLPVQSWDALIVPIITEKLDYFTKSEWQKTLNCEIPTLTNLTEFLDRKCQLLESLHQTYNKANTNHNQRTTNGHKQGSNLTNKTRVNSFVSTNKAYCYFCKSTNHFIYNCSEFLNLSIIDRTRNIKNSKAFINCLRNNHLVDNCKSKITCRECKQTHNTLLHTADADQIQNNKASTSNVVNTYISNYADFTSVLLSTAVIKIRDSNGQYQECRALLDVGSQSNIISKSLCDIKLPIAGINCSMNTVTKKTKVEIKSKTNNYTAKFDCLVLHDITANLPTQSFNLSSINIPKNITLADPNFNQSGPIELLIGAELFWQLLCKDQIKSTKGQPHFQSTQIGWIVGGPINLNQNKSVICHLTTISSENDLQRLVSKLFREIDEPASKIHLSPEENDCEVYFQKTVKRDNDGRFIVRLPFKPAVNTLGQSKDIALNRFYATEAKLNKHPNLRQEYCKFMEEYSNLKHMAVIKAELDIETNNTFYLPHHAVLKPSSVSTQLRVVFDGSCKTSTGVRLNDILMVGPNIQQDLFSIISRFRTYQYVLTSDISKMYRQILVDERDLEYQRILWRDDTTKPIKTFRLKTITYGISSASWLACRTLHELANQEQSKHPIAYFIIKNDFYMDDLLTGANTIIEAETIRNELVTVMKGGGFDLCKWASNHPPLLPKPKVHSNNGSTILNLDRDNNIKLLGLIWDSKLDVLKYSVNSIDIPKIITKRHILSVIARIFDPLGLISPIITKAKIILQMVWTLKLDWDEPISGSIQENWVELMHGLDILNSITISRKVLPMYLAHNIELHAFCDASQQAYGAVI